MKMAPNVLCEKDWGSENNVCDIGPAAAAKHWESDVKNSGGENLIQLELFHEAR